MLKQVGVEAALLFLIMAAHSRGAYGGGAMSPVTPDEAMKQLKEGNERYAADKAVHPEQDRLLSSVEGAE